MKCGALNLGCLLQFKSDCICAIPLLAPNSRLNIPPPPQPFLSPSGVESVSHAWQELRSGVPPPPRCRGEGSAEATCSFNRSLLTWGSNRGTCSYISPHSTGEDNTHRPLTRGTSGRLKGLCWRLISPETISYNSHIPFFRARHKSSHGVV